MVVIQDPLLMVASVRVGKNMSQVLRERITFMKTIIRLDVDQNL